MHTVRSFVLMLAVVLQFAAAVPAAAAPPRLADVLAPIASAPYEQHSVALKQQVVAELEQLDLEAVGPSRVSAVAGHLGHYADPVRFDDPKVGHNIPYTIHVPSG